VHQQGPGITGSEISCTTALSVGRGVAQGVFGATGDRLASKAALVGSPAGDAPFVAEGVGAAPSIGNRTIGIADAGDAPFVAEGIDGGPCLANRTTSKPLSRSGSSTRERDRQSGGKNCKGFHDCAPFGCRPFRVNHLTFTT